MAENDPQKQDGQNDPLVFNDEPSGGKGIGKAVIIIVVLLAAGAAGYFGYSYLSKSKATAPAASAPQGLYSSDGVQGVLVNALKDGDEFSVLKFMDVEDVDAGSAKKSGKKDKSVLDVYKEILAYEPENPAVKDGLEKYFYLNIHRAEKARRKKQYQTALKFYRQAAKIKPKSKDVIDGIALTKKSMSLKKKPEPLALKRSYESVYEVVQSNLNLVKYLYDKEKRISPNIKGKINVEFVIVPSGKVSEVKVVGGTMKSEKMEKLLAKHIRMWSFGKVDESVGDLRMSYPFVFY